MKKQFLVVSLIALVGSLGWADPTPQPDACKQLKDACAKMGFQMDGKARKGKRLYKDCIQAIMDGKTVNGVTVDPQVVQACRLRGKSGN